MRNPFRERLEDGTILFDGGMGTMLYAKGIYINTCFDELNLTAPHLVRQVHERNPAHWLPALEASIVGGTR